MTTKFDKGTELVRRRRDAARDIAKAATALVESEVEIDEEERDTIVSAVGESVAVVPAATFDALWDAVQEWNKACSDLAAYMENTSHGC